jgi:hypothetical protein
VAAQDVKLSVGPREDSLSPFNLTFAAADGFSLINPSHYFAHLKKLLTKITSIPLYLSNLSLLF